MRTKLISYFMKAVLAVSAVLALSQCADEEKIIDQSDPFTEAAQVSTTDKAASSFTITGIHTVVNNDIDCSTCTFYVQPSAHIIDGAVLKFKPGTVICLNNAVAYQQLEFVNLVGTEQNPIIIASCGQ